MDPVPNHHGLLGGVPGGVARRAPLHRRAFAESLLWVEAGASQAVP